MPHFAFDKEYEGFKNCSNVDKSQLQEHEVDGMQMCSHRAITAGTESATEHNMILTGKDSCFVPNRLQGHLLERLERDAHKL